MVSVEIVQASEAATTSVINEQPTSPRISFSSDFLDESNFISITPQSQQQHSHHHHHHHHHHQDHQKDQENEKLQEKDGVRNTDTADFEFLSNTNDVSSHNMSSADELFFEGKLLPFWQMPHPVEKLNKISLKSKDHESEDVTTTTTTTTTNDFKEAAAVTETRVSWFVDDDPSPRPPKCTVLWKELLRLRKQRASSSSSSLSPSSSSSSTSSSRSSSSLVDIVVTKEGKLGSSENNRDNNNHVIIKRIKKGLERTRSASIRIRPMVNVPICTQVKNNSSLPPLFPLKKGRSER